MKVKIIKAEMSTYWYAKKIGKIYNVKQLPDGTYERIDKGHSSWFIERGDCRPQKRLKVAKRATNKQMATTLWNYLFNKYGHSDGSSGHSVWFIHLTRQRLNSAWKAITKA